MIGNILRLFVLFSFFTFGLTAVGSQGVQDDNPPEVFLVAPADGDFVNGTVELFALAEDAVSNVTNVSFGYSSNRYGYSTTWFSGSRIKDNVWNGSLDTTGFVDDAYYLSVRSNDSSGNQRVVEDAAEIIVDNTAPFLDDLYFIEGFTNVHSSGHGFSSAPVLDGSNFNGGLDLIIQSADNFASLQSVKSVEFGYGRGGNVTWLPFSDQKAKFSEANKASWHIPFNTAGVADGYYNLSVRGTDFAGNQNVSLNFAEVAFDNTAPNVSLAAPLGGSFSGVFELSAASNDSLSGVWRVEFGYGNSDAGVIWIPGSEVEPGVWNTSFEAARFLDGFYSLSVRSTDFAGNRKVSWNVSDISVSRTELDNTAPSLSLTSPAEGDNVTGFLEFEALSHDNLSGVYSVEFGYRRPGSGEITWIPGRKETVRPDDHRYSHDLQISTSRFGTASYALADGSYFLSVRSTDFAGNRNVSEDVIEVVIDSTDPSFVKWISPVDDGSYTGIIDLSVFSGDNGSGVMNVIFWYWRANGQEFIHATEGLDGYWNATLNTSDFGEESLSIYAESYDFAGHWEQSRIQIRVDNTAPVLSISQLSPVTGTFSGILTVSAGNYDSPIEKIEFGYGQGVNVTWFPGYMVYYPVRSSYGLLDTAMLEDGSYNLSVRVTDPAGNQAVYRNFGEIEVDNTAPDISFVTPVSGNYSGSLEFSALSDDSGAGVDRVSFGYGRSGGGVVWVSGNEIRSGVWNVSVNVSRYFLNGSYDLSVRSTDDAGNERVLWNVSGITLSSPTADDIPPDVSLISPETGTNVNALFFSKASSYDNLSGIYSVEFGYRQSSVDEVTWISGRNDLNVSEWFFFFGNHQFEDGFYHLSVRSTDFAGNQNVSLDVAGMVMDHTEPFVKFVNPDYETYYDFISVYDSYLFLGGVLELSALSSDAVSGVERVIFDYEKEDSDTYVRGFILGNESPEGYWNATLDTSNLSDGIYEINVRSYDFSGLKNSSYIIILVDNTPPVVSLLSPKSGNYSGYLFFSALSADSGVDYFDNSDRSFHGLTGVKSLEFGYSNPDSDVVWISGNHFGNDFWIGSLDTNKIPAGSYNLSVRSTDFAENQRVLWNVSEVILSPAQDVMDSSAPAVSLIFPEAGIFSYIPFFASSGDGVTAVSLRGVDVRDANVSGVKSVEFGYRTSGGIVEWVGSLGGFFGDMYYDSPYDVQSLLNTIAWFWSNALVVEDGSYFLSVRSTDFAGNQNVSKEIEVVVDNNGPSVEWVHPVDGSNLSSIPELRVSASDAGVGAERVKIIYSPSDHIRRKYFSSSYVHSIPITVTKGANGYWTAAFNTTPLVDGIYELTAYAYDSYDNSNYLDIEVVVDNTPPVVSLVAPEAGNFSGTVGFSARSSDGLTGVKSVEFGYRRGSGRVSWFSGREVVSGVWNGSLSTRRLRDGSYNVSIRSFDFAGNNVSLLDVVEIVVDAPDAPTSSDDDSGGGGGGGGGSGGGSDENDEKEDDEDNVREVRNSDVVSQIRSLNRISEGSTANFIFSRSGLPVSSVKFNVSEDMRNVEVTVSSQPERPSQVSEDYNGTVYRYVTLNESNVNESSISSLTIVFGVDKDFVSDNEASEGDVVLLRYDGGEWVEAETRLSSSSGSSYSYEAVSDDFGYYVVALRSASGTQEDSEQSPVATEPETEEPPGIPETEDVVPEGPDRGWVLYTVITVIVVIMLAGGVIVFVHMRPGGFSYEVVEHPHDEGESFSDSLADESSSSEHKF